MEDDTGIAEERHLLSFAQQRMWTLQLLEPDSYTYNICSALEVRGPMKLDLVRQAAAMLVERHEALRTVFRAGCEAPYAIVLPVHPIEVETVDLQSCAAGQKNIRVHRLAEEEARRPIELSSFPLFRFTVVHLSPEEHILLLTVHHIIADDWSRSLLLRELVTLVDALSREQPNPLPPVGSRYVDEARAQVEALTGEQCEHHAAYWKAQLSGDLSPLHLPTFRSRPATFTHRGALREFAFSSDLSTGVEKAAEDNHVSTFTFLLSGLNALLYRYTGRQDLTVGTAFAGRERPEVQDVVGNFVSTVALRTELTDDMTFGTLLRRVQHTVDDGIEHASFPFERIVEMVRAPRDPSHNPIFQVMFVMPERPLGHFSTEDMVLSPVHVHNGTAKLDLTCIVWQDGDLIRGTVEYCTDVLDDGFIDRMLMHLQVLLAAAVANPRKPLYALPVLAEAERDQLVHVWNATEKPYASSRCVHDLFQDAVRSSPDSTAVEFENMKLSYRQLNERANMLASYLRSQGVTRDIPVAIALERSPEMVVALLGVATSGGYYVPIDPRWPVARIVQILSSLQAAYLLTQWSLLPLADEISQAHSRLAHIVCLDGEPQDLNAASVLHPRASLCTVEDLERMSRENPPPVAVSEDTAYVIFTSGSTGTPKGVVVQHKRVINLIEWVNRMFSVGPADRLLFVTSLCFDLSVYDVFGILAAGGVVSIASSADLHDPARLVRLLCDRSITFWDSAPAMLQQMSPLFSLVPPDRNGALRLVFLSGDWIPVTLPDSVTAAFPKARVIGLGGATEATVWSNYFPIDRVDPAWKSIPYGRPIQNARYYVLDRHLSPCPIGVAGDLFIGGDCLASGYANDLERTRERFIHDVFSVDSNAVMYKTGDCARFMPDGNIEFLGRSDNQVKVRGFRIELGEIESALRKHAAVRDVVVATRGERTDKELVAYLAVKEGTSSNISVLRRHLQNLIPEYMIPAQWMFLDRIPQTPNGKVDLKALPDPGNLRPELGQAYLAPRDDLEKVVTRIWCEILGLQTVGVQDRFFDLGGTSLKAVRAVTRIKEELGTEISALAIFETPTIAELVQTLKHSRIETIEAAPVDHAAPDKDVSPSRRRDMAIVGMAARFPGARNVQEFWVNLREGRESFIELTEEELRQSGEDEALLRNPNYVRICATIQDVDKFDASFFGINPREAELMDPQHRAFLECAWSALEDAGYDPYTFEGSIGVFGGVARNAYFTSNVVAHPNYLKDSANYTLILGNDKDYPAMRISYKLNLRGPSIGIQTACSSSGVALHLACQSLAAGDSDMALVGGCRIIVPKAGYLFVDGGTLSPDGHVRAFDQAACGMVRGSGVGFLVLKRLEDALLDGDCIRAVVRGSAVTNDGSDKVGFTAPSVSGQAAAIAAAIRNAGLTADALSYVEAHGTGTSLGDPIEVAALTKAFRESTDRNSFCFLGSVKTNIGHLDAGACVAGIIKTVLALEHGEIPPSLNFKKSNPRIDFPGSPFVVNDQLRKWPFDGSPRRAGVSSVGLGGTNVHVVLEEAPARPPSSSSLPWQLVILSARSAAALDAANAGLSNHLSSNVDVSLADVAYTLQLGRVPLQHRRYVVSRTPEDAARLLLSPDAQHCGGGVVPEGRSNVVFMFPGQGSQQVNMARELYDTVASFRSRVDECCEILKSIGTDLRTTLLPPCGEAERAAIQLDQTAMAQPALFVVEYALARLLMEWGVTPSAMIGHSSGEYAAACLAGTFSLQDALRIVAARARFMQAVQPGGMCAVLMTEDELAPYLDDGVALAAVNAPRSCVLAGPSQAIAEITARLEKHGVKTLMLRTSHAFHSSMMDPVLTPFAEEVARYRMSPPLIPFISCVTGTWITDADATNPAYWASQLRHPVRFSKGIASLRGESGLILVEVGPGTVLSNNARRHFGEDRSVGIIPSLPHETDRRGALESVLRALGKMWVTGVKVDWRSLHTGQRRYRVPLPGYPFERKRYWIEPPARAEAATAVCTPTPASAPEAAATELMPPQPRTDTAASQVPVSQLSTKETTRKQRIISKLRSMMTDVSGVEFRDTDLATTFLEMGLDSLLLTQVASNLQTAFGVPVKFRQLLENLVSIDALADYLDKELPPSALPAEVAGPPIPAPQDQPAGSGAIQFPAGTAPLQGGSVEQVFLQQLRLMSRQLEMLGHGITSPEQAAITAQMGRVLHGGGAREQSSGPDKAFGAGTQIDRTGDRTLIPGQRASLDKFIAGYTARTRRSKEYTQEHRAHFADPRTVTGFSPQLKEVVYPIVVDRSRGSRLWDIDGNEYIDLTGCFGANLLGFSPPFIVKSIRRQLGRGIEIGPQHPLAGPAARLMSEITGFERIVFCNTGSEAVMGAMRLVRAVSGRNVIVTFTHSYHGNFDEVLVRGTKTKRSVPAAPGIPPQSVGNLLVLDYGAEESLRIIRERAGDLAAVMVEPVQTRDLSHQPREFLHQLRSLTEQLGVALIFDELVTGFRVHLGGAQAYFGVHADLATYGKIIAAGVPIGAIAGSAKYMDALDGGFWRFGDDSIPEVGVTYFAGTFVRHPLAMAATVASLEYLKRKGPELQLGLNRVMDRFVADLHAHFAKVHAPISIKHFGSACRFYFETESPYHALFYPWLRNKGIHIYESRTWFLTAAHSARDMALTVKAIKETVSEMIEAGFIAPSARQSSDTDASLNRRRAVEPVDAPAPGARLGRDPHGDAAWFMEEQGKPGRYRRISPFIEADSARPDTFDKSVPVEFNPFSHDEVSMVVPATEAQTEVWLTAKMTEGGNCAFNESVSVRLKGSIDLDPLRAAVAEGIKRHESMRMTFTSDGSSICVASSVNVDVAVVDLSGLSDGERRSRLDALLKREVVDPFDLEFGPLIRANVVKLGEDDHQIVITSHHIVCDGWSIDIVVKDIGALYSAAVRNAASGLKEPERYSWYALHMAELAAGREYAEAESYWLGVFSGDVPALDLPLDHPRPPARSFEAQQVDLPMDSDLLEGVKQVASGLGCTFVTILLAGFKVLLHRLSGQEDIVVGLPAAGQSMVGKDLLVGHCVNLLPLRSKLEASLRFSNYVKALRAVMLDAYEHQQITFGRLLKKLRLRRDPSRIPLVSVIFNIDTGIDLEGMKFGDLDVDFHANPRAYENFELFLNVSPVRGGQFVFELTYNSNLFEAETARRWLQELTILLRGIVKDPEQTLAGIPLLGPEEQYELPRRWNPPPTEFPRDKCVHQLIAEQVERTPDAPAVRCAEEMLTYRQLDERSDLVATSLINLRIGRGDLVGVLVERSADMVIAVLGVLKAGAAYVPLDPSFPQDRLSSMTDDAGCAAILTQRPLAALVPSRTAKVMVLEDVLGAAAPRSQRGQSGPAGTAADLAYVIYTSGSTGKPKGVEVNHRSVVNFLHSMRKEPGMTADDVLLAVTTLSFDIAGLELFLPLSVGAQTVIVSRDVAADGRRLLETLRSCGATAMQATPTTWRLLLEAGWRSAPGFHALCGGEALSRELANSIMDAGAELWNLYGPTETTIWSAIDKVTRGEGSPPLGHPIANTQLYVLDSAREPLPIGVSGELCIGGEGLARGYHGRKDLTEEKFVPDPFASSPEARLYHTGDLVQRRGDGALLFLGRTDSQVKLRGYRMELGDIEAHLATHPGVSQSVAVVREDVPGARRLVAYYVPQQQCRPGAEDLRTYLQGRLPEYMVPSFFVAVEKMPLTHNGKVDRKALPRPEINDASRCSCTAPRNKAEESLARLWERLLDVRPMSVTASFFDLGGDSLLAARLFAELERTTGKAMPLATLFASPTIEALARALEKKDAHAAGWSPLVPVQPKGTKPPLFLVHGAEGNVLLYRELASCLGLEQPVYGLQSQGLDGVSTPAASIEEMASRYTQEILHQDPRGPYYLGGYCMGGAVALEMAQRLTSMGKEVRFLGMIETYNLRAASRRSLLLREAHNHAQNLVYHLLNIFAAGRFGDVSFLREKYLVEKKRIALRMRIALTAAAAAMGLRGTVTYHHRRVDKLNEAAHQAYTPRTYPGKIVLFRPRTHYTGYQDPLFGWGEIAQGGVEVHTLRVYPRGMLVQPFVRELGQEFQRALQNHHS